MPPGSDDLPDPDALARAEAALSRLSDDYLSWAEADCAMLRTCVTEIHAHPSEATDGLWRMFRVAHDMKGQAATFGYPLVTEIALRLCRRIEATPEPDPAALAVIARHVDALAEVVAGRLAGDGGESGREILGRLK